MQCSEVMNSDVIVVDPDDTVKTAAIRMRDANVGFLPVCDDAGKVIGTITDRDIALRVDAEGRSASTCPVGDVMTHETICCRATDSLARAEQLMAEHKKSRVLVTDEDGFLEGVVSLSDIAQFEGPRRIAETMRNVTSREAHS
jgi:CBS domain-containing protein